MGFLLVDPYFLSFPAELILRKGEQWQQILSLWIRSIFRGEIKITFDIVASPESVTLKQIA